MYLNWNKKEEILVLNKIKCLSNLVSGKNYDKHEYMNIIYTQIMILVQIQFYLMGRFKYHSCGINNEIIIWLKKQWFSKRYFSNPTIRIDLI